MRNRKSLIIYLVLCLAMILTSIATTLALVTDEHEKSSNVIRFDKVSLCADNKGSKLSINVNNLLGNGEVLFDRALDDNEYLYVNPTSDSADCYIRFKLVYTLGNEVLDEENSEVLGYLNDLEYLYKGFKANNVDGQNYGFTYQNGYYYLVTETTGEGKLLKVVTSGDFGKNFIMSEKYVLNVNEEHIDAVVELSNAHDLMLKVEVEAIQCFNLSSVIEDNPFEEDEILDSNTEDSLEALYGNTTIEDYEESGRLNILATTPDITVKFNLNENFLKNLTGAESVEIIGLKEDLIITKDEENVTLDSKNVYAVVNNVKYIISNWCINASCTKIMEKNTNYLELLNLSNSRAKLTLYASWKELVTLKTTYSETNSSSAFLGSSSGLSRNKISSLTFTGKQPDLTGKNYKTIDCGTKAGNIFAYWITNGSFYNVIVYQEGGVYFNPNSSYLFAYVGWTSGVCPKLDMRNWDINTTFVTNMNYMFESCTNLLTLILGPGFDTSNVTNMSFMFENTGNISTMDFGPNFDTTNVRYMNDMFRHGIKKVKNLNLGEKFNSKNAVSVHYIFFWGFQSVTTLNIGNLFVETSTIKEINRWSDFYDRNIPPFEGSGHSGITIIAKNQNAVNFLKNNNNNANWGDGRVVLG